SGLMLGSMALDQQLHDSYFVVAHLHYVLIGGAVFPLFGAFHYWFPKMTGRLLSEALARWSFWLFFIGFNVAFFPMHMLGLQGMTRRVYTYGADAGWQVLNQVSTAGALLIAMAVLLFICNVWRSLRHGHQAGSNPWAASTLEWFTPSPPPPYSFVRQRVVASRDPLWDAEAPGEVTGLPVDVRSTLVTHLVDARPDHVELLVSPSVAPFLTALAVSAMFIGTIDSPWAVVWGGVFVAAALVYWFWPSRKETEQHVSHEVKPWDDLKKARS